MKKLINIFQIIVIIICNLLIVSFVFTMLRNIVNHGNVIGTIGCLVVITAILLYRKYNKNRKIRLASRVVLIFAGVFAVYCAVISSFMVSGMMNTPQTAFSAGTDGTYEPETVIVLGCKTINGAPSVMLAARLDKAAEYLEENPQAVCIVTGGKGSDEIEAEAQTMEQYLITKGISAERIYKEDKATNTEENIRYSAEIIEKEKLPENVIIVSESYHVYRGMRNAQKLGLNAAALPAPTNTPWALPSYWLREIFALSRDFAADLF